ncbi:MAG: polysaccharide deacetylase family protein, partial [Armatimonadota bacterium]
AADRLIARDGPTPILRSLRGAAQLSMYEIGDARDSFGRALAREPDHVPALMGMAVCAIRDGAFADAAGIYRSILSRHEASPSAARAGLAFALVACGEPASAMRHIAALHERDQMDAFAYHVEALALVHTGDDARALAALRRASVLTQHQRLQPVMSPMVICTPNVLAPSQQTVASARETAAYLRLLSGETTAAHPEVVPVPALPAATSHLPPHGPRVAMRPREAARFSQPGTPTPKPSAARPQALPTSAAPSATRNVETGFAVISPADGATVSGLVDVRLSVPRTFRLSYVSLSVDGALRSMTNLPPYRFTFDTRNFPDGTHRIIAQAHDRAGLVIDAADVVVVFANEERTDLPREARLLREVEARLIEYLALRPHPLDDTYLAGRIHQRAGRLGDAVAAYEYVFTAQPLYPGVRADLVAVYDRLGIVRSAEGHRADEVRSLPTLPSGGKRIALTFDDGPNPSLTPSILDDLDAVGAKATFLLVGKQAELYPDLVREIHDRGHELGCHSYSHTNQSQLPTVEIERELVKTRAIIRELTGEFVVYFRPPGGRYDDDVRRAVGEMGYTTVWWTTAITRYANLPTDTVLQRLLADIKPGAIVLLHNGYDETVPVLRPLLRALRERGYEMVTLSDGLGRTPPGPMRR